MTKDKSKRDSVQTAVLYMRVSTKRQAEEGYSLEEQDKELPAFCERRALTVLESFVDRGESGRSMDRPEFQSLLRYCKQHRPSFVVVSSMSRFA
jgi:site-specific DNA recombinase